MKIPNGVTSADMGLAAIQDASGLLCVLDIRTGELLARSEDNAVPLLIERQRIIGYRFGAGGAMEVFAARSADGELRNIWSARFSIPDWAGKPATLIDGLSIDARVDDSELLLRWRARSSYRGGAPPTAAIEQAARQDVGATIRLGLDDGTLVAEQSWIPSGDDDASESATRESSRGRSVVAYRDGKTLATRAWQTAGYSAFLSRPAGGRGISLMHELPGGPKLIGDLSLAVDAEATVTARGQLVFVREGPVVGAHWRVFSAENAAVMATLTFDPGTVELVSDGELVFVLVHENRGVSQNIELRCRSLRDGELIWRFNLGERERPAPMPFPR